MEALKVRRYYNWSAENGAVERVGGHLEAGNMGFPGKCCQVCESILEAGRASWATHKTEGLLTRDAHTPHPPGYMRIDIKQKDLQIGMLEVVENKGANLRLKGVLMHLVEVEKRSGRGLVRTNAI
jgi:hypothetical protein